MDEDMVDVSAETHLEGSEIIKPNAGRPSWKNRRLVIFATLIFCAFCVMYIMFQGNDTRVNETIVLSCFALAGSVIGFYVAGAAWTDVNIEKIKSNAPRAQISQTTKEDAKEPDVITPLANGKGLEDN